MNLFSKRPLALLSLFAILGSLFTHLFRRSGGSPLWTLLPFLLFFILTLLPLLRNRRHALPFLLALVLLLGYGTQSAYHAVCHTPWRSMDAGSLHTLTADVREQQRADSGVTYLVKAKTLDGKKTHIRLLLKTDADGEILQKGDCITVNVAVTDYGDEYLYSKGIAGHAEAAEPPLLLSREDPAEKNLLSSLKKALSERLSRGVTGDGYGFYSALLLGERSLLADRHTLAFRRSGTMHLLALSGMHLTVLGVLLLRLLRTLRAPPPLRFILLLLFLFLYAAIAGFPLSLLRASLMLAIYELGRLLRLLSDPVTSLFFSVALIVLLSPAAAPDIGLLLSFLATLGILTATEIYPNIPLRKNGRRLLYAIGFSLLSGLWALLLTAMVTATVFGHISLLALPANLLLSPLVNLALALGPFLLLFPTVFGPIANGLSALILDGVHLASEIRGAYAMAQHPIFIIALALFSAYLALLLMRELPSRRAFFLRFLAATAALCSLFAVLHIPAASQDFLLISRQDSSDYLVLRQKRRTTVIACTYSGNAASLLGHLEEYGINEVDTLILTHETGKEESLLDFLSGRIIVREAILSYKCKDEARSAALSAYAEEQGVLLSQAGDSTLTLNGLTIKLLPIGGDTSSELLLSLDHRTGRIVYASPSALAAVNTETVHRFIGQAELLYIGAHPKPASRELPLLLPDGCRLLTAYPALLPDVLTKDAEKITPYGIFYMPLS